jgi:hypothetical protein
MKETGILMTPEQELLWLREQNIQLIHALRRLERENDNLERVYKKKRAGWKNELENMLKGLKNRNDRHGVEKVA